MPAIFGDFQLDPSWKREDMKVVAVLSAFDSSKIPPAAPWKTVCQWSSNKGGGLVKTETVAAEAVPESIFRPLRHNPL